MKLAAYLRVSTERQASQNDSLSGQLIAIKAWAKNAGHTICKVYEEPGSAYQGTRPEFETMISESTSGNAGYEGIVVYSFSRFSRNELSRLTAEEKLEKAGVKLYSCTEQLPDDLDLAHFVKGLLGIVNEHQRKLCHILNTIGDMSAFEIVNPQPFRCGLTVT